MLILLEIMAIALVAVAVARLTPQPWRGRLLNLLKAWVTVRAFWLLLTHPVAMDPSQIADLHLQGMVDADATHVVAWRLIQAQLSLIEASTFWGFCAAAAAIKFIGILASMLRWQILLRGQRIELPFRHIFGSFLIGRFIGTFLPSTAGLDGYTLYDAARFSGRTVEVTAAKALEKVIGVSGIFLSFLVALPAGIGMFYSIFERDVALTVAGLGTALCAAVIGGLLVVLWFPGLVQWLIEHLPLPGKARLEGVVMRVSHAAAAYKDKKRLIVLALVLSFVVHFTTAAMYYFTALAISAVGAEFWPIVLASSIQILATVLSPFTIAGEGIRELAQLVLLQNMIGAAAAIVSAALGFWAAEALTLMGGVVWWIRPRNYRPAYCRVDGQQVDYEEAARAATALESEEERTRRSEGRPVADLPPLVTRLRLSAGVGLGAGLVAGLLVGGVESLVIAAGGFGGEAQALWYGPLSYAVLLGALGLGGGLVLGLLPMDRLEIQGWTSSLALIALGVMPALVITLFRVRRDVFHEQMPPLPVLLGILGAAGVLSLALFLVGPRLFRGAAGRLMRPLPALALTLVVAAAGAVSARIAAPGEPAPGDPPPVPSALAERPNLVLIIVDTLRADVLSCYGGPVEAPALCGLADQDGSIFKGFSHASWTKPATASLMTSTLPSTHGAISKVSALPRDLDLISEAVQRQGYRTGGIVSNINLAPSFGFDQGFDEYTYLGPDYLFGAEESSSKLVFYQIGRKVWLKVKGGHRVSDFYQDAVTVNRAAFEWLERHRDSRFFLLLHYMDPHDPYFVHPYDGTAVARVEQEHPDPASAARLRELYDGEIRWLDQHLAALFDRMRELGLYDDSLIVLTSDHGEEFHEHGGWWHGKTLYEEQIHVPLLVKWPIGAAEAPRRADALPVRLIDVGPTMVARSGAAVPESMQGVDLAIPPAERSERDRMAYAEEDHEGNVLRSIRTERWKWIEANEGNPRGLPELELFAIDEDPGETRNLADEKDALAAELRSHADAQARLAASRAVESDEPVQLSRDECEKLRVLGYVQDCDTVN